MANQMAHMDPGGCMYEEEPYDNNTEFSNNNNVDKWAWLHREMEDEREQQEYERAKKTMEIAAKIDATRRCKNYDEFVQHFKEAEACIATMTLIAMYANGTFGVADAAIPRTEGALWAVAHFDTGVTSWPDACAAAAERLYIYYTVEDGRHVLDTDKIECSVFDFVHDVKKLVSDNTGYRPQSLYVIAYHHVPDWTPLAAFYGPLDKLYTEHRMFVTMRFSIRDLIQVRNIFTRL